MPRILPTTFLAMSWSLWPPRINKLVGEHHYGWNRKNKERGECDCLTCRLGWTAPVAVAVAKNKGREL